MAGELNMEGHPGSLHELEQLLSMDGIPHERVPTDDFFADYLHGLSTLAARQAESNNTNSGCSGPGLSASCAQPTASTAVPAAAAFSGGLHTGLASGSFVTGGSMVSGANGMAPLAFAPSVAAAAGGWSFPHGGLVALHGQPGMMAAAPAVLPLLGMVGMVSKACKEGKAAGRNGGKPARLNQRQATNREAQKRYRERQKARLLEMQVTIDRLHRELAQRRGVQGRNQRLEELHCRLQVQLAQAECEVEQLQWQAAQAKRESHQLAHHASSVDDARAADIDGGAPTDGPMAPTAGTAEQQGEAAWGSPEHAQRQASLASSAAGSAVGASAGGGVATAAECTRVGPQHTGTLDGHQPCSTGAAQQGVYSGSGQAPRRNDTLPLGAEEAAELAAAAVADPLAGMYGPPPPHEAFDSLLSRFQAQVARVKGFLEEHGLRLCDPSAATLPPALRGQILVLVQESLGICRDLLRVEGVDVIELLQRQDEEAMASSGALTGSMLRQKWLHVIQVLHLTGEQRQQLLLQRSAHLALMARIYRQRQQLNMQAMSLMLLPSGGAASGGSPSAADCRAASGGQAAKLAVVLRLVKENLRREQRAAMEINACTLSRILTPIQAALYVCEAFPLHCDALGMCNALSTLGATSGKTGSAAGSAGTPRHSVTSPASSMG